MTSHANFLANTENAFRCVGDRQVRGSRAGDAGQRAAVSRHRLQQPAAGANELGATTFILPNALDLEGFLRTVSEHRIEMLTSVPAIYHALTRHPLFAETDLSHVRWVSYGGAPIAADAVHKIMEAFPDARVGNGFGLTETSSITSFLPHEEAVEHADSVGFAMPVVDIALDEPDPETGVGELLVRGENVVQGYWNNPRRAPRRSSTAGCTPATSRGSTSDGLLYIVDRAKDMINRGGENVYSIEVESALAGAPGVSEVAVVPVPDEMMGEKVGAVIVAGDGFDVEIVIAHAKQRIADFKVPQYVALREQPLPRNPGGKVLKRQLREQTEWGEPLR